MAVNHSCDAYVAQRTDTTSLYAYSQAMRSRKRSTPVARESVAAARVDRYLTRQLHKTPGFERVAVSVGYRLQVPDEDGCNWSGHVVPMYETHCSLADMVSERLRPFIKTARARFNLSE